MKKIICLLSLALLASCATKKVVTAEKSLTGFDAVLSGYNYPFPVSSYAFETQGQKLQMSYMDIKPGTEVKKTVVMFHGKNFGGFYFEPIVKELVSKGFRVIVPDQIGFGKSSKPEHFQYSFQLLARLTDDLLKQLGAQEFTLVGHSMGGMLAN